MRLISPDDFDAMDMNICAEGLTAADQVFEAGDPMEAALLAARAAVERVRDEWLTDEQADRTAKWCARHAELKWTGPTEWGSWLRDIALEEQAERGGQ